MGEKIENKKNFWLQIGLKLFVHISGFIVFPILIAVYLGSWLDSRYDKEPMFFIICIAVAFLITNIGIVFVSIKAMKEMKENEKIKQEDNDKI